MSAPLELINEALDAAKAAIIDSGIESADWDFETRTSSETPFGFEGLVVTEADKVRFIAAEAVAIGSVRVMHLTVKRATRGKTVVTISVVE